MTQCNANATLHNASTTETHNGEPSTGKKSVNAIRRSSIEAERICKRHSLHVGARTINKVVPCGGQGELLWVIFGDRPKNEFERGKNRRFGFGDRTQQ
jgi:hypothetical protein